jgi:hypothetical protein
MTSPHADHNAAQARAAQARADHAGASRVVVCRRCGHEHSPDYVVGLERAYVGARLLGYCAYCGCVRWLCVIRRSSAELLLRHRAPGHAPKAPSRAA